MKETTLLAYRNNNTWQELQDALLQRATREAVGDGTELLVKVFPPKSKPDDIDAWISQIRTSYNITHFIADGTVAERLIAKGFSLDECENYYGLNGYLGIKTRDTFNHIPVDQLYSTCFARLVEVVRPDLWVIVSNHIADYDPLGMFANEKSDKDTTDGQITAYIKKLKGFIPSGQSVGVVDGYDHDMVRGKRVVVICHHHAKNNIEPDVLEGTNNGSLWLNSYPSAIIRDLVTVIQTDDLIGGDVMEILRKRLLEE